MKKYKIEMTALAEMDLENACDYIAYCLKNPDAAKRTVQGIRKQVNSLNRRRYNLHNQDLTYAS